MNALLTVSLLFSVSYSIGDGSGNSSLLTKLQNSTTLTMKEALEERRSNSAAVHPQSLYTIDFEEVEILKETLFKENVYFN